VVGVAGAVVGVAGAVVGVSTVTGVGGRGIVVGSVFGVPLVDVGATDVNVGSVDAVGPAVAVSTIMSIPGPGRRVGITVGVDSATVATAVALETAFCAVGEGVTVIAASDPPQATNARARTARAVHIRGLDRTNLDCPPKLVTGPISRPLSRIQAWLSAMHFRPDAL